MAKLAPMPPIAISQSSLASFGQTWANNNGSLSRTPPNSSGDLGRLFDSAVGASLAVMLGGIPIETPNANALTPAKSDCVEVGPVRIIGGVRPQNFDVGYRPDGPRFAFDSKTLNDKKSVGKNWQNMVNDLSTEATTVHSRFPHAVVAFMVILPLPAVELAQRSAITETLERLARRVSVEDPLYMAEVISLVFWEPAKGAINATLPSPDSPQVEAVYRSRYKGLLPHSE